MATIIIDSGTIEKISEVTTRYRRKELVQQKKFLLEEIDRINQLKEGLQAQIANLNIIIAEMDALNVTNEE